MSLNPANTTYTVRSPWTPVYVRGRANSATAPLYLAGALVEPASATYLLEDPAGTTVVTSAATITGSVATFSLTDTHLPSTAILSADYRETWTLTLDDGAVLVRDRQVAVAIRDWSPVVTDQDLTNQFAQLGTTRPEARTSFQTWIDEAWAQILGALQEAGIFPQRILNAERLRAWHRHLTLGLYFESAALGGHPNANWSSLAKHHMEMAEKAQNRCVVNYDTNDDGRPDAQGDLRSLSRGPIYINAAPTGAGLRRSRRW